MGCRCFVRAASQSPLVKAKAADEVQVIPPALLDLHPGLQVDLGAQKALHVCPGHGGDLLQHGPLLADDNALMRIPLAVNGCLHIHDILIGTLLHGHNFHRNPMRHLILQKIERLFADNLRCNLAFGLIRHHIRREILRSLGKIFRMTDSSSPVFLSFMAEIGTTSAKGYALL